jgi:hypothetical protein
MYLVEGQIYSIKARVINQSGAGPYSNVLDITYDKSEQNPENMVLTIDDVYLNAYWDYTYETKEAIT